MPTPSNKYRLNFVITNAGVAKGYRVTLTQQNIDFHIKKYGGNRPELLDKNFIDKDIEETMQNPDAVYRRIKSIDATGKVIFEKNVYAFYKENVGRRYSKNGIVVKHYVCVRVRKAWLQKTLVVITPYYTPTINEEKRCKPITKI